MKEITLPNHTGDLAEIRELVKADKITLLRDEDGVAKGFVVDSGLRADIDDIEGMRFQKAFAGKDVMKMIAIAKAETEGNTADLFDEEGNVTNNNIFKILNPEIAARLEKEWQDTVARLFAKPEDEEDSDEEECDSDEDGDSDGDEEELEEECEYCDKCFEKDSSTHKDDPDTETLILNTWDLNPDLPIKTAVKRYIWIAYGHCLQKGTVGDLRIEHIGKYKIKVSNIKLGRKLTAKELEDIGD